MFAFTSSSDECYEGFMFESLETVVNQGERKGKQEFNIVPDHPLFNNIEIKKDVVYRLVYNPDELTQKNELWQKAEIFLNVINK